MGKMRLFGIQNARESPLFKSEHVEALAFQLDSRCVADDIDKALQRMQAAEQIIVFAVGAGKEPCEMTEACPFQTLRAFKALKRTHVLRADAVDENFVQFAAVARSSHGKRQHVPERK